MDHVERAQRQYRRLFPQPVPVGHNMPTEKLLVWVKDDVCGVVEMYCQRPAFKDYALWPLHALVPGAGTAERGVVESVSAGLVQSARALLALARQKTVQRQLQALFPATQETTTETVEVTGAGVRRVEVRREAVDRLSLEIVQVEQIAGRFWTDLVCPLDYFSPRGGWLELPAGEGNRGALGQPGFRGIPGEFIVDLNPSLHPIGDFVSRCLLRRVEILLGLLSIFRRKCLQAVQKVGRVRASRARPCGHAHRFSRADCNSIHRVSFRLLTKYCNSA